MRTHDCPSPKPGLLPPKSSSSCKWLCPSALLTPNSRTHTGFPWHLLGPIFSTLEFPDRPMHSAHVPHPDPSPLSPASPQPEPSTLKDQLPTDWVPCDRPNRSPQAHPVGGAPALACPLETGRKPEMCRNRGLRLARLSVALTCPRAPGPAPGVLPAPRCRVSCRRARPGGPSHRVLRGRRGDA